MSYNISLLNICLWSFRIVSFTTSFHISSPFRFCNYTSTCTHYSLASVEDMEEPCRRLMWRALRSAEYGMQLWSTFPFWCVHSTVRVYRFCCEAHWMIPFLFLFKWCKIAPWIKLSMWNLYHVITSCYSSYNDSSAVRYEHLWFR